LPYCSSCFLDILSWYKRHSITILKLYRSVMKHEETGPVDFLEMSLFFVLLTEPMIYFFLVILETENVY